MPDPDRRARFSLDYELQPSDLAEFYRMDRARRRRRTRVLVSLAAWGILAVAFTAITVALNEPSVVRDSSGAPGWIFAVDIISWSIAAGSARIAWRLSPRALIRRVWNASPGLRGRHRDEVSMAGVTSITPAGGETFIPWANFGRIRETEDAFIFLGAKFGRPMCALPKRGLARRDQVPALRQFLEEAVGGQRAAGPSQAAAEPPH
jgi:hypothetical protein